MVPSPSWCAIVRPNAANSISSIGTRSRRRASSISVVSATVSDDALRARSGSPGAPAVCSPATFSVDAVAVLSQ